MAAKNLDAVDADERDQERDELDTERFVRVERGTGRLRVLGDQFEVAERGDGSDEEGDEERNPSRTTDFGGDIACQRIHAGA